MPADYYLHIMNNTDLIIQENCHYNNQDVDEHEYEDKWDLHKIISLLRLYAAHRCLWDPYDADNRNRKERKAALIDIATCLDESMTINQLVSKINVLRATYRYEKRRIKQRIRKGLGAKTKLKWFAIADAFLRKIPRFKKLKDIMTRDHDSDSELDDSIVFEIEPELLNNQQVITTNSSSMPTSSQQNLTNVELQVEDFFNTAEGNKFVNFLHTLPQLVDFTAENDTYYADVENLATQMQKTVPEICQLIIKFRCVYNAETMKMKLSPTYMTPYKWWTLASQFMVQTVDEHVVSENFVDVNELPPLTPNPEVSANFTVDEDNTKYILNGLEDNLLEGKWSLKYSVKFLRLYGAHSCLWDLNDANYRSREMRNAAIEDIAAAMGGGLSADFVAKKIKIFRITYMQHRKRMIEAQKQGKETKTQLLWFPLADSFLRKHIGLRSISAAEPEIPQFEFQDVVTNLNLIDPALLVKDFCGKGSQNVIDPPLFMERQD